MKANHIILAYLLIVTCNTDGHSQTYSLTITNEPYDSLVSGSLLVDDSWSDPEIIAPIGFAFTYFGDLLDTLYAPDYFAGAYFGTSLNLEPMNLLLPFGVDLIDRGYEIDSLMSPILFKTEGETGQRIFTIEYRNAGFTSGEINSNIYTDYINFQLRIYEESNNISVHIGPYSTLNPGLDFEGFTGPSIGLIEGFDFENEEILGEIFILGGDPLNPTIITDLTPLNLNWPIPENTVYTFTPIIMFNNSIIRKHFDNYYSPSPTNGLISLLPEKLINITSPISVFDSMGCLISAEHKHTIIDLSNYSNGVYYLKFETKFGPTLQRIVVNQ